MNDWKEMFEGGHKAHKPIFGLPPKGRTFPFRDGGVPDRIGVSTGC